MGVKGGLNLKHADYDNDGDLDFIILRGAWFFTEGRIPNSLIRNNGDGTFTDVTLEAGIYSEAPTQTCVWADFDLDGWIDLFIANESMPNIQAPSELYLNNRNGTFRLESQAAGLVETGFFKGATAADINNDFYPDLYLSNLSGDNYLYLNVPQQSGVKFRSLGTRLNVSSPFESFPTWMFDYNNDGMEDIFVSGYPNGTASAGQLMMEGISNTYAQHPYHPYLYKNNGDGTFTDVSLQVGITEATTTMGCNYGDLDNDGFIDFYLASGEPNLFSIVPNRMYRNNRGINFEDVTYTGGFGHIQKGHAVGWGDLDMDGDQDIYAVMGGAFEGDIYRNILYENTVGNQNNWVNIKLEGTRSNRSAIGARIILGLTENGVRRIVYHTVGTGASFGGNSILAEIGLGKAQQIDILTINWPNKERTSETFTNIPVNLNYKLVEGTNNLEVQQIAPKPFILKEGHRH